MELECLYLGICDKNKNQKGPEQEAENTPTKL